MIHQYAINISQIENIEQLFPIISFVSEKRKLQIEKLFFHKDKTRCLFSELLLKYALFNSFDIRLSEKDIVYSDFGKPYLNSQPYKFNISHSGDWVVCSVGNSKIGVDIEEIKNIDIKTVCFNFSEAEREYIECSDSKNEDFYKLWTLKESYLKYLGVGLNRSLSSFSILIDKEDILLIDDKNKSVKVKFDSLKIDSFHYYAQCYSNIEESSGIFKITFDDIMSFI